MILEEPYVNALEGTVLFQSSCNFVKKFISNKSRPRVQLGHVGSKTRSLGQILEKTLCILYRAQFWFNLRETLSE